MKKIILVLLLPLILLAINFAGLTLEHPSVNYTKLNDSFSSSSWSELSLKKPPPNSYNFLGLPADALRLNGSDPIIKYGSYYGFPLVFYIRNASYIPGVLPIPDKVSVLNTFNLVSDTLILILLTLMAATLIIFVPKKNKTKDSKETKPKPQSLKSSDADVS